MKGFYTVNRANNEKLLVINNKTAYIIYHYLQSRFCFKKTTFKGIEIQKGQFATNYEKIASDLKLKISQVIYSIRLLKKHKLISTFIHTVKGIKTLIFSTLTDAFTDAKKSVNTNNTNNLQQTQKPTLTDAFTDAHNYNKRRMYLRKEYNNISHGFKRLYNIPEKENLENFEKFENFEKRWKNTIAYATENTKYTYATDKYDYNFWNYLKKFKEPLVNIFKLLEAALKNNINIANIQLSKHYRTIKQYCTSNLNAYDIYNMLINAIKTKKIRSADDLYALIQKPILRGCK